MQGKWFPQESDISVPLAIRRAVFSQGRDALDDMAQQVVVYEQGVPVGAARLWWAKGAFCIGEVGVLEQKRGQGFGDLLMRLLLFKAVTHHAVWVEVSASPAVMPFFARYGFRPEGKDAGHGEGEAPVTMRIRGEDISLGHGGGACGKGCP